MWSESKLLLDILYKKCVLENGLDQIGATTLRIMTFSIKTLSIIGLVVALGIKGTQHNKTVIMLSVVMLIGEFFIIIMLNVIMSLC